MYFGMHTMIVPWNTNFYTTQYEQEYVHCSLNLWLNNEVARVRLIYSRVDRILHAPAVAWTQNMLKAPQLSSYGMLKNISIGMTCTDIIMNESTTTQLKLTHQQVYCFTALLLHGCWAVKNLQMKRHKIFMDNRWNLNFVISPNSIP